MNNSNCPNSKDWKRLNDEVERMREHLGVLNEESGIMQTDIKWIKTEISNLKAIVRGLEKCLNQRPTWLFTLVLGAFSSILVGLIVFLLTH